MDSQLGKRRGLIFVVGSCHVDADLVQIELLALSLTLVLALYSKICRNSIQLVEVRCLDWRIIPTLGLAIETEVVVVSMVDLGH